MRPNKLHLVVSAVVALCSGCGLITGLDDHDRCDGHPDVSIVAGDEVWFRWGNCWVDQMLVIDDEFRGVWVVEGKVRSPVQYGVAKNKMDVRAGPEPLEPGSTYTLTLSIDTDEGLAVSNWSFTR